MIKHSKAARVCIEQPHSIAFIKSDGNYSIIYLLNGEKVMSSYTSKFLMDTYKLPLKRVNRQVLVNPTIGKKTDKGVTILGEFFAFSRRTIWALVLLPFFAFAQNTAPVAVNDTLKVCNDVAGNIQVTTNDYDVNGDRLILSGFTNPTGIDIVAAGNTGQFRFDFQGNVGTFNFDYTIRDLKFGGIGSKTATASVFISSASPYTYAGTYTTTNDRTACRSSTSGTVVIANGARQTMKVDTYGELLPGTLIEPDGTGVFELTVKQ